jgi:hypothetical protein
MPVNVALLLYLPHKLGTAVSLQMSDSVRRPTGCSASRRISEPSHPPVPSLNSLIGFGMPRVQDMQDMAGFNTGSHSFIHIRRDSVRQVCRVSSARKRHFDNSIGYQAAGQAR